MNLYRKLAIYFTKRSRPALAYNFRNAGESATGDARRDRTIRISDWILYDVPAATAALRERFSNVKRVVIGRSIGAHDMLATQVEGPTDAMVVIVSHAGITRTVKTVAERAEVWIIFNIVSPVRSRLLGYAPIDSLRIGRIIPVGVMARWSTWTRKPGYFFADPELSLAECFKQTTGPLLSVVFTNDLWVNRPAVDVLANQAVQCDVVRRDIEVEEDTKNGPIGHTDFYWSKNRALWPEVAAWVEAM